jgi:hypothetical protein
MSQENIFATTSEKDSSADLCADLLVHLFAGFLSLVVSPK